MVSKAFLFSKQFEFQALPEVWRDQGIDIGQTQLSVSYRFCKHVKYYLRITLTYMRTVGI